MNERTKGTDVHKQDYPNRIPNKARCQRKKIQIQAISPGTRKLTEDTQTDKEGGG